MVRLFVQAGEGQHPLVPRTPEPMFANAEIGGALIISVGLSAIWAGYRRIRAEPFVARSFMRVNTTSLAALSCVAVLGKYEEYKYIHKPVYKMEGINMRPFQFLEWNRRFTMDSGLLLEGVIGSAISAFRSKWLHTRTFQRAIAGFSVGGLVGSCLTPLGGSQNMQHTNSVFRSQLSAQEEAYRKLLRDQDPWFVNQLSDSVVRLVRSRANVSAPILPNVSSPQPSEAHNTSMPAMGDELKRRPELPMANAEPKSLQDALVSIVEGIERVVQAKEEMSREFDQSGRANKSLEIQLKMYESLNQSLQLLREQLEATVRDPQRGASSSRLGGEEDHQGLLDGEDEKSLRLPAATLFLEQLKKFRSETLEKLVEVGADAAVVDRFLTSCDVVIKEHELDLERRETKKPQESGQNEPRGRCATLG